MEKKVVLIVLVVIAVVAFMFLGAGLLRNQGSDLKAQDYRPGTVFKKMDTLFARSRKPFDRSRMVPRTDGCTLSPQGVLAWSGECGIVIKTSKTKSSAFVLKRGSSHAEACYAFSNDELRKCWGDDEQRGELDKEKHRFVVTKDSAFMQLKCLGLNAQCSIIVE